MKKLILTAALVALIPFFLMAHPPKKVDLTFNKENNKLKIVVTHNVSDVNTHYIKEIKISVDGKEVKTINPTKQLTPDNEIDEVSIPEIKQGSKVEVKATCNRFGSKKANIIIQ